MQFAFGARRRLACAEGSRRLRPTPLAAALALAASALGAHAATIVVNDASDTSVAGKCSLVDAVSALNGATAVNACAAGDGNNDTIDLSFFSTPTEIVFSLATSPDTKSALELSKPATLRGPLDGSTPRVTIRRSSVSGTPSFRVLATNADLTIQGVAISNGLVSGRGAGIYAKGSANLKLTHAFVHDNAIDAGPSYAGGGIDTENGSTTVTRSIISNNHASGYGGGIYTPNAGAIVLTDSTLSGNTAGAGGGVYSFYGSVALNRSTISGNAAANKGGGVFARENIVLTNSTVANNTAGNTGGGLQTYDSGITMYFSTVSGNSATYTGGGVQSGDNFSLTAVGSIISGNSAASYANIDLQIFEFYGNRNIIGAPPAGAPMDTRDCDAKLGALADNGGPTQTKLPGTGSCAIDAGPATPPATVATDQRGAAYLRQSGSATDIGAVEVQPAGERIFYDGFDDFQ